MLKKVFFLFLLLYFSSAFKLFSNSKSDNVISYVSGKVVDERKFPQQYVKVIINGIETETDNFGKFRILNVPSPYDIAIADKYTSTAMIYKNLTVDNPELILFGVNSDKNTNAALVNVSFPEIPVNKTALLKFISTDVFSGKEVEVYSGEASKSIPVYWPQSKSTISGKIIFLQKDTYGYESYIEKSITLNKSKLPVKIKLASGNSSLTKTKSLTVFSQNKNVSNKLISVSADFTDFSKSSELILFKDEGINTSVKCLLPVKLSQQIRYKISGNVKFDDGSGYESSLFTKAETKITLSSESPPELQTPTDNFLGANGNTEFYYSLGSGTGIFVVQFKSVNSNINFYIVTRERTTYLNYLSRDEFRRSGSVEFYWKVKKYLTYFSVDDFVKPSEFRIDFGYKAVLYSKERNFKTGYY